MHLVRGHPAQMARSGAPDRSRSSSRHRSIGTVGSATGSASTFFRLETGALTDNSYLKVLVESRSIPIGDLHRGVGWLCSQVDAWRGPDLHARRWPWPHSAASYRFLFCASSAITSNGRAR